MKRALLTSLGVLLVAAAGAIAIAWPRAEMIPSASPDNWAATPANLARGAYLAKAGDCLACHTTRGGADYAGGRAIPTPFGTLNAPNITPDRQHGIGTWSADDFWNAMHNGISKDGRLLYPAFPYTNYTRVTRADSDALYAFLRSVPSAATPRQAHALRFPYNQQVMLAGWRLLYFKPATFEPLPNQSSQWNRGAYLVQGLGHCNACHSSRNTFGATQAGLSGGLIPMLGWYAPSLTSDVEAGLGSWRVGDLVQLLKTGVSPRSTVTGPMAEVVARSLQHLSDADVTAMAVYLKSLPSTPAPARIRDDSPRVQRMAEQGRKIYETHCIDCHGADGRGMPPHYPPLAGNRVLNMDSSVNAVRIVLNGGFAPGTAGNPRPYGMPPYSHLLSDAEVAALLTYLRTSWGNQAAAVEVSEVNRYRAVPLE